jgi:hypothetical protein
VQSDRQHRLSGSGAELLLGDECSIYNDCAPGLVCVTMAGRATCTTVCSIQAGCPGGGTCVPSGDTYGYCSQ